jgi:hypothetical protein
LIRLRRIEARNPKQFPNTQREKLRKTGERQLPILMIPTAGIDSVARTPYIIAG